jgi:hypothetical protein
MSSTLNSGNSPCQFFPPVFLHQCTLQVGYKVPWTAISSLLHQFNQQFQQPKVLLWLNLAYFLPSMPALLLHSSLQDLLERKLGVPKAAMARCANCRSPTSLTSAMATCPSRTHPQPRHMLASTVTDKDSHCAHLSGSLGPWQGFKLHIKRQSATHIV